MKTVSRAEFEALTARVAMLEACAPKPIINLTNSEIPGSMKWDWRNQTDLLNTDPATLGKSLVRPTMLDIELPTSFSQLRDVTKVAQTLTEIRDRYAIIRANTRQLIFDYQWPDIAHTAANHIGALEDAEAGRPTHDSPEWIKAAARRDDWLGAWKTVQADNDLRASFLRPVTDGVFANCYLVDNSSLIEDAGFVRVAIGEGRRNANGKPVLALFMAGIELNKGKPAYQFVQMSDERMLNAFRVAHSHADGIAIWGKDLSPEMQSQLNRVLLKI